MGQKKNRELNCFEPDPKALKKMRSLLLTSNYFSISIKDTHLQKGDGSVLLECRIFYFKMYV